MTKLSPNSFGYKDNVSGVSSPKVRALATAHIMGLLKVLMQTNYTPTCLASTLTIPLFLELLIC